MPHPPQRSTPEAGTGSPGERLRRLVEARTGLFHDEDQEISLLEALEASAAEAGVSSSRILEALGGARPAEARDLLVPFLSRIVTSETYFFRDPQQLNALRDHVLPELTRRRGLSLRLWSAGCSTGEEAYTLAMLVCRALGPGAAPHSLVLATDIDHRSLAVASQAAYGRNSLRGVEEELLRACFRSEDGRWLVRDPFRRMVHFRSHNLVSDPLPDPESGLAGVDLILCRNVLQYFSDETASEVLGGLSRALAHGGYLLVGHAENHRVACESLERVHLEGTMLYRKKGRPEREARRPAPGRKGSLPAVAYALSGTAGRGQADRGKTEEAVESLGRTLDKKPFDVEARYLLALLDLERGKEASAESHLRKVLLLEPAHLPAMFTLARQLEGKGRRGESASLRDRIEGELAGLEDGEPVPFAEGLTAGEMRESLRNPECDR